MQPPGADEGNPQSAVIESTWQAKYSLRTVQHKFILAREQDLLGNPPRELYDLKADPLEEHNLAEEQTGLAADFEAELEGWIAGHLQKLGKSKDPVKEEGAGNAPHLLRSLRTV